LFYFRSLEIKVKAVGTEHRIVAIAHMNLGTLEAVRKKLPKMLGIYRSGTENPRGRFT